LNFSDILLIVISSAGLLHGLFFAVYLCFLKKKRTLPNLLLGLILIFMAIRIGKSVILHFGHDLEPLFIFAGLSFLTAIGPLLRWYVAAMIQPDFKLPNYYLAEFLPFLLFFVMSFFVSQAWFDENNRQAIMVFAATIIFIYLHFAFYIFTSGIKVWKAKKTYAILQPIKSQQAILQWLGILIIGFAVIWVSYFLNIIEDTIPYVIGPIVYSIVIYYLSYQAFQLKSTSLNGKAFKKNDNALLFDQITKLVVNEKLYLDTEISLARLSKRINQSTQKTSETINQHAQRNFNDFMNYYRIQAAKNLLSDQHFQNFTIASIAFDTGFNSLSSFNSAFKKFEGITPSSFRKQQLS